MKTMKRINCFFLLLPLLLMLAVNQVSAQEEEEKEEAPVTETVLRLRYFNENNQLQYLILESLSKTGRIAVPLPNQVCEVYMDEQIEENLIAKVTTDEKGKAKCFIPPSLKALWDEMPMHLFIAVTKDKEEEITTEIEITKARIQIDTLSEDGVRSISVMVMMLEDSVWVPAEEVEMKVGIRRLGGILSAGEDETYTTDEEGMVSVELNKANMPGDEQGNIILRARVEESDLFGNLIIEKTARWGVPVIGDDSFFEQRSLWSTRFRAPYWLLVMAYGIAFSVWGVIIYLVIQIFRIKKLGTLNRE
ncbi:MAG TPA: hypothetical protein DIW47_02060 [Bacteroidetes bacterium]|nr:hypothetical protein [Bacteroidota bacterium]